MRQAVALKGRLADPENIKLDEPVFALKGRVNVTLSTDEDEDRPTKLSLFDWLATRPPGKRTKEDIDRQMAEERASWGDR